MALRIIPIIEAVNSTTSDLFRCLNELEEKGSNPVIIANPQVGFFSKNQRKLNVLIDEIIDINPNVCLAFWLTEGTTFEQLENFFGKYNNQNISIIHSASSKDLEGLFALIGQCINFKWNFFIKEKTGRKYRSHFNDYDNVLLEDSFNKLDRNADYDEEEFFSDNIFTFDQENFIGVGDYTILGSKYTENGGPAITAAIHLTYEEEEEEVWIKHFLSEQRDKVEEDGSTLVSEALPKLIEFLEENEKTLSFSHACQEFKDIYDSGERTSLGKIKKISIKHHIELMNYILSNR
ncbi:sce7725 family protein [Yokenella regensburgei]|uniref:sce7725 family protein n=1 Tax=Yokenella regensburgei TaxID=158877 RepID=UPI003F1833F9